MSFSIPWSNCIVGHLNTNKTFHSMQKSSNLDWNDKLRHIKPTITTWLRNYLRKTDVLLIRLRHSRITHKHLLLRGETSLYTHCHFMLLTAHHFLRAFLFFPYVLWATCLYQSWFARTSYGHPYCKHY